MTGVLQEVAYHLEGPFENPTALVQYLLMKKAKEIGVAVVLNGHGSDEALAGYPNQFVPLFLADQLPGHPFRFLKETLRFREDDRMDVAGESRPRGQGAETGEGVRGLPVGPLVTPRPEVGALGPSTQRRDRARGPVGPEHRALEDVLDLHAPAVAADGGPDEHGGIRGVAIAVHGLPARGVRVQPSRRAQAQERLHQGHPAGHDADAPPRCHRPGPGEEAVRGALGLLAARAVRGSGRGRAPRIVPARGTRGHVRSPERVRAFLNGSSSSTDTGRIWRTFNAELCMRAFSGEPARNARTT